MKLILEATFLVTKEKVQNAMEIRHRIVIDKDLNLVEEMIESKSRKIKILEGKFSEETNVINSDNMQLMNLLDKSTITTLFMSKEIKLGKYRDMIMFLIIAVIKLEIISEIKDDNFAKIKLEQNKKNGNKEELYKKINDQNLNPNNNITDVTIVDELDAHLHDVLLNQLLNFVCDNECGQLIFTIHNLSVMDKLKEKTIIRKYIKKQRNLKF